MGRISGEAELSMENYDNEFKSSGTSQKDGTTIFEEKLRLETQGDLYHQNLMAYSAAIILGLNQQSFESDGETDSSSGDFIGYEVDTNWLPLKPYPFRINLSRTDSVVPRRFRSPLRVEDTAEGFSMKLRVPDWPMVFSWSRSDTLQDSDLGDISDMFERSTERWSYTLQHDFSEQSHLVFRSDLDKISQNSGGLSYDVDTARHRLEHDYFFGDNRQHHLDSSLLFVDKSGNFDSQRLNWTENLILTHSENFATFYNTVFATDTFSGSQSRTIAGAAGLNHRLYKNLLTSFDVFASKTDFDGGNETNWHGGELRFDYTRNNPWGRLSSEYSINMTFRERFGETGSAFVIDEAHVFNDPFVITLNERNIDTSSIVVTDITGLIVYVVDQDYTITVVGDRVELTIDPLEGTIPDISDGQTLLVDYFFDVTGTVKEDTVRQDFRIEQDFDNGLSVFYAHRRRDEQVDSDVDPTITSNEFTNHTFGAAYRRGGATLRAEHSRTDATLDSTDSTRLSANYIWLLSPGTTLSAGVSQSWIDTTGVTSRETSLFKARGRIRSRLNRNVKISANADWRNEDSTDQGKTEGLTLGADLEYDYRAFNFTAGWEINSLDRRDTESSDSMFYLRLIRRF